jgi:predicted DNA-binding antitoxin AbrB/MazE fold protein
MDMELRIGVYNDKGLFRSSLENRGIYYCRFGEELVLQKIDDMVPEAKDLDPRQIGRFARTYLGELLFCAEREMTLQGGLASLFGRVQLSPNQIVRVREGDRLRIPISQGQYVELKLFESVIDETLEDETTELRYKPN